MVKGNMNSIVPCEDSQSKAELQWFLHLRSIQQLWLPQILKTISFGGDKIDSGLLFDRFFYLVCSCLLM